MTPRIFLDTDIILDLLLARQPFFRPATELFQRLQDGLVEGFVSPLIFSNLFYILRKERSSATEAITALRKLRLLVRVLPVDEQILDRALASSFSDFEDAIQYYTAMSSEIDTIVTRNKTDFRSSKIPVYTAEEYLEIYRSRH
jgi:predicted nucleic acid-binding protein